MTLDNTTTCPDETPLVSVIVPTFNRAHCLEQALLSVQAQDYTNWEFIIADDASTDGTYELAEKLAKEEPRIRLLPRAEQNQGAAVSRSRAMSAAKGKYLALLDSDDKWLPNKLSVQVAAMEAADESVGICFTGAKIIKNDGPRYSYDIPEKEWEKDPLSYIAIGKLHFTTSTTMLTRRCVETVGEMSYELRRGQDIDYWIRIFLADFRLLTIPDVLSVMCLVTKKSNLTKSVQIKRDFFIKHYYDIIKELKGKLFADKFACHLELEIVYISFRELHWNLAIVALFHAFSKDPIHTLHLFPTFCIKAALCGIYYSLK